MAMIVPLFIGIEPRIAAPTHEVITIIEIAAPPEVVWRHVLRFPDLPAPTEPLFRAGVAAPVRARADRASVTSFSSSASTMVEPIDFATTLMPRLATGILTARSSHG